MTKITAVTMKPLSLPNMMGMGPIRITPPVLTSVFLVVVLCSAVPRNIRIKPIKITIIPAIMMVLPLIINISKIL
jgi:hypothetical protein